MRWSALIVVCLGCLEAAPAGEKGKSPPPRLTPQELSDRWILLFDGETPYGWASEIEENNERRRVQLKVDKDALVIGSLKNKGIQRAFLPVSLDHFELKIEYRIETKGEVNAALVLMRGTLPASKHEFSRTDNTLDSWAELILKVKYNPNKKRQEYEEIGQVGAKQILGSGATQIIEGSPALHVETGLGTRLLIRNLKIRPMQTQSLFNGKDLTGWREYPGKKSKFTVNERGELDLQDGPGDLQTTQIFGDFILQLECKSRGKHLNSGVFFRCLPKEYQQGYEAQIRNEFTKEATQEYTLDDYFEGKFLGKMKVKSPAVDYGTGAIYRRMPARMGLAKDGEWFHMTIFAQGRNLATWINGVQVVRWTDHRLPSDNARNGYRAEPGSISLQGHDPTTNFGFRNFRLAEIIPVEKKK